MSKENEVDIVNASDADLNNCASAEELNKKIDKSDADVIEFTSTEELNKIGVDSNVNIVGFVDSVDAVKTFKSNNQLLKFIIHNGAGVTVQVNAWNEEIPRIEQEISVYQMIHLENVKAKKTTNYNGGNFTGAELTIQKYTIIENLGKIDKKRIASLNVKEIIVEENLRTINLNELSSTVLPKKFRTVGFLKTNISITKNECNGFKKAYCVITNGTLKLNATINNYQEVDEFVRGDHVAVIGSSFFLNNIIHLSVKSDNDIKK